MPDVLVVRGGRVLDETGRARRRRARARRHRSPRSGPGIDAPAGREGARRRRLRRVARARRHPGPLPRAGPRGGGDDRDRRPRRRARRVHRGRRHAEHDAAARRRRRSSPRSSRRAARSSCLVTVAGCITQGRAGDELAPLGELYDLGVRVFTDDGDCVADANVMRRAFEYALALPGRGDRAARRGSRPRRGRAHARRGVVGEARHPGPAGRGGVDDRRPRPRARRS